MTHVVEFLTNHWILSSLFLLVLLALILNELTQHSGNEAIGPHELVELMNHQDCKVIDIRAKNNFQDGHIIGSENIPLALLPQKLNSLNAYQNKPIVLVCAIGQSAKQAAVVLKQNNFKEVFILDGGLNAWRAAAMPLQK